MGIFDRHHALFVGIGQYERTDKIARLDAAGDAEALRICLTRIGYLNAHVRQLVDYEAGKTAIYKKLRELALLDDVDLLLICWSGHASNRNNTTYLLPYDADPDDIEGSAIDVDELFRRVALGAAKHKAVLFDICHSRANAQALRLLMSHPQAAHGRSITFLGASTETSREDARGGGVGTNSLIDAVGGRNQALSRRGLVHVDQAFVHAKYEVMRRAAAVWQEDTDSRSSLNPSWVLDGNESAPIGLYVPDFLRDRLRDFQQPARSLAMKLGDAQWSPHSAGDARPLSPTLQPFADVLIPLAHGHFSAESAWDLYCDCVRAVVLSWSDDPILQRYVHRLVYYLLACKEPDRHRTANLVDLTHDYMLDSEEDGRMRSALDLLTQALREANVPEVLALYLSLIHI